MKKPATPLTFSLGRKYNAKELQELFSGKGEWTEINLPDHGGFAFVVTAMDGEVAASKLCQERAAFMIEAGNHYQALKDAPDLMPTIQHMVDTMTAIRKTGEPQASRLAKQALNALADKIGSPKDCPCCDSAALYTVGNKLTRTPDLVECTGCGLRVEYDEPGAALKAWNARRAGTA